MMAVSVQLGTYHVTTTRVSRRRPLVLRDLSVWPVAAVKG